MIYVKKMAKTGSSPDLVPKANMDNPGSNLSLDSAWRSLAEPMTPIKVEKSVTAHSPAKTTGAERFVSGMTFAFFRNDSWVVLAAMEKMTTR